MQKKHHDWIWKMYLQFIDTFSRMHGRNPTNAECVKIYERISKKFIELEKFELESEK